MIKLFKLCISKYNNYGKFIIFTVFFAKYYLLPKKKRHFWFFFGKGDWKNNSNSTDENKISTTINWSCSIFLMEISFDFFFNFLRITPHEWKLPCQETCQEDLNHIYKYIKKDRSLINLFNGKKIYW